MPVNHEFQSGRADNGDAGAIQPSHFNAPHALTGMLAVLDALAPTPNVVVTFDGSSELQLAPRADFAPTSSPAFTDVPTAPTPDPAVNSNQIATMAALHAAIDALIGGAPGVLDTLNELAAAINDDASYAAAVTAALAARLRVDAAQGLSAPQKAQGISNLGLGTASTLDMGVAASNVVQLDGSARLPAVDGSQLLNIAGLLAYASVQSLTADQQAVVQANAGVRFNGIVVESRAANATTYAIKTPSGANPSAATPVVFCFKDAAGGFAYRYVTAALSITIPSGTSIGTASGTKSPIYLYAIDNAGAVELAVSLKYFNAYDVVSTTAIAAGAVSTTMYSTAARASKNFMSIAVAHQVQTTAGTWAAAPTSILLAPFPFKLYAFAVGLTGNQALAAATSTKIQFATASFTDVDGVYDTVTNYRFTCQEPGLYDFSTTVTTNSGNPVQITVIKNASAQNVAAAPASLGGGTTNMLLSLTPGETVHVTAYTTLADAVYGTVVSTNFRGRMIRPG